MVKVRVALISLIYAENLVRLPEDNR